MKFAKNKRPRSLWIVSTSVVKALLFPNTIDKKEIQLDEPIKELGNSKIEINLGYELETKIKIMFTETQKPFEKIPNFFVLRIRSNFTNR